MVQGSGAGRLLPRAFTPLPLGVIRPAGWLLGQLRLQADGLSGHLDEFWPDIAGSGWIGGPAEGWERGGPYWLDGVVPLAFVLDDAALLGKVRHWIDEILARQLPDGWLGPVRDPQHGYPYDPWPSFVALKALTQFQEATGDARIIPAIARFPAPPRRRTRPGPAAVVGADALGRSGPEHPLALRAHRRGVDPRPSRRRSTTRGSTGGAHFAHFPYHEKTAPRRLHR